MSEKSDKVIRVDFGAHAKKVDGAKRRGSLGEENLAAAERAKELHLQGLRSAEPVHRLSGFLAQNAGPIREALQELRAKGQVQTLLIDGVMSPDLREGHTVWRDLAKLLEGGGPSDFRPLTGTFLTWFKHNFPDSPEPKIMFLSGLVQIV